MVEQLHDPKTFNGAPLTGSMVAELTTQLAEALLQDHPAINPPELLGLTDLWGRSTWVASSKATVRDDMGSYPPSPLQKRSAGPKIGKHN